MNHRSERPRTTAILRAALSRALDWRLLALLTTTVLLTTAVAAIPAWSVLSGALDFSPRAQEIAQSFDLLAFSDIGMAFSRSAAPLTGAALIAALLAVFSWPLLAGISLTAADGPRSFRALLEGGFGYYGRMLRLGLVAVLPFMLAGGIAGFAFQAARRYGARAVLESQARSASTAALVVASIVFVLVHATLELGRAAFGADEALRSGWQAWLRGIGLAVRHPLQVLGAYVGATLASYAVALPLFVARVRVSGPSAAELVLGFVLAQLGVAALGWGRAARLLALTALSRSHSPASLTPVDAPEAVTAPVGAVPSDPVVSRS